MASFVDSLRSQALLEFCIRSFFWTLLQAAYSVQHQGGSSSLAQHIVPHHQDFGHPSFQPKAMECEKPLQCMECNWRHLRQPGILPGIKRTQKRSSSIQRHGPCRRMIDPTDDCITSGSYWSECQKWSKYTISISGWLFSAMQAVHSYLRYAYLNPLMSYMCPLVQGWNSLGRRMAALLVQGPAKQDQDAQ